MTPREREIREKQEFHRPHAVDFGLCNGAQEWWESVEYLLAQLTTAREIIEVAKGAITDNRNHWHHIDADPNGKCTACNALAKITEMEKEK